MALNLKNTITQTENLKNKIKKATLNINTTLAEFAGVEANNLADVPNKIDELSRGTTKMSRGTCYLSFEFGRTQQQTIDTRALFNVRNVFLKLTHGDEKWISSFYHAYGQYYTIYFKEEPNGMGGWRIPRARLMLTVEGGSRIKITTAGDTSDFRIIEWIAVE